MLFRSDLKKNLRDVGKAGLQIPPVEQWQEADSSLSSGRSNGDCPFICGRISGKLCESDFFEALFEKALNCCERFDAYKG